VNLGKINKVSRTFLSPSLAVRSPHPNLSLKAKAHLNVFAVIESAAKPALAAKKLQL
jgi:hypothetical protein